MVLLGCDASDFPRSDEAWLTVTGARAALVSRENTPFSQATGDDALTTTLALDNDRVAAGAVDRHFTLSFGTSSDPTKSGRSSGVTAAYIALEGDPTGAAWTVIAAPPDIAAPDAPTFDGLFSLAATVPSGDRDLLVRAVDDSGTLGPIARRTLHIANASAPAAPLTVTLRWDTGADLDLRVVDPRGDEIGPGASKNRDSSLQTTGDANGACGPDPRQTEAIVGTANAPRGEYMVRVDTPALCGAPNARYRVEAWKDGALLAAAYGTAFPADTEGAHGRGAGVLALRFTLAEP